MELKDRKRIKNGLPGFQNGFTRWDSVFDAPKLEKPNLGKTDVMSLKIGDNQSSLGGKKGTTPSSAAGMGPWFALGEWVGSGIGAGINSIRNTDQILADAGSSEKSINGISYESINDVGDMKNYNREMGMSFLTNPFKGLAMLIGRRSQKRALARAERQRQETNKFNMSGALDSYLEQEYANKYGDPQNQILYSKNGKDSVHTSEGEFNITPNSKTEGGEIVYNKERGTAHVIPGVANGDNNYSSILPSDTIITNRFGLANKARNAAKALESVNEKKQNRGVLGEQTDELIKNQATAILDNVAEEQRQYRAMGMLPQPELKKYKDGKGRFPSNWWIDGLGALSATGNLIADSLQKVKRSNTYRQNPYANNALRMLASLNINPYPINKQLMDQERRNLYAINHMGGLSGAQKAFTNVASGLGTLNSIATSNAKIQEQNNAYKSAYANAAINAGQADRQARIATNQWDLDYYSKAHAAKQQMIQQDIYNALAALQQGYKNNFDKYTFDNIMSRYTV